MNSHYHVYIRIAIYFITASIGIKPYISKFSQIKYSILIPPSYLHDALPKSIWKAFFIRERLKITQETLEISLFPCTFLRLVKKSCFTLSFDCTVVTAGRSTKEGLNHLLLGACLRKNQERLQISVFSLILSWDTSTWSQVSNCNGAVLEICSDQKF